MDYTRLKVVLAAYDTPGLIGMENLFGLGVKPYNIILLTHRRDSRNAPVIDFASANQIETITSGPKTRLVFRRVMDMQPDILLSLHYRKKIPGEILDIPKFGCVNLHPSLLPEYRGCFSGTWALINGETLAGYTYHYMLEDFDTGNIILQKAVPILKNDTAFSLFHRLLIESMRSFEVVLEKVMKYRYPGIPQPKKGSYYPRKLPCNGEIDLKWDDAKIERFIRAMIFPPFKFAVLKIGRKKFEVQSMAHFRALMLKVSAGKDRIQK